MSPRPRNVKLCDDRYPSHDSPRWLLERAVLPGLEVAFNNASLKHVGKYAVEIAGIKHAVEIGIEGSHVYKLIFCQI
jgi:hypothetical protein